MGLINGLLTTLINLNNPIILLVILNFPMEA